MSFISPETTLTDSYGEVSLISKDGGMSKSSDKLYFTDKVLLLFFSSSCSFDPASSFVLTALDSFCSRLFCSTPVECLHCSARRRDGTERATIVPLAQR